MMAGVVVYDPEAGTVTARRLSGLDAPKKPTASDDPKRHSYPVDSAVEGVAIRVVLTATGRVDDAYACSITTSAVSSVRIPSRRRADHNRTTERLSAHEAGVPTETPEKTDTRREQWLVDCWLRQQAGF